MSTQLIPVEDVRLSQPSAAFAVKVGTASANAIVTAASSASASAITASVVPPARQFVLDKANSTFQYDVCWSMLVTQSTTIANGVRICSPGLTFAPSFAFLHQAMTSASVTLNSATASTQFGQSMAAIRRAIKTKKNRAWRGGGGKLPSLASNADAWGTLASVVSDFSQTLSSDDLGNGSFPIRFCNAAYTELALGAPGTYNDGSASNAGAGVVVSYDAQGRIVSSPATLNTPFLVFCKMSCVERPMISPFSYYDVSEDQPGIAGLTSLSFTLTLGSIARCIQWSSAAEGSTISQIALASNTPFPSFNIFTQWLTPAVVAPRMPKSKCAYTTIQSWSNTGAATAAGATGVTHQLSSIQLGQVPSLIALQVSASATTYAANPQLAELNLAPTQLNLSFANVSGIASSWSPFDLFTRSKHAGLSMSWPEFQGTACVAGVNVPTVGGIIFLRPGIDYALPESCAPGQAGSWNISAQITTRNQTTVDMSVNLPQVTLTAFFDGFFESDEASGATSASMIGLSEEQVLSAQRKDERISTAMPRAMKAQQEVGGGLLSGLFGLGRSLVGMAAPALIKSLAEKGGERVANGVADRVFGAKPAEGKGLTGGGRTGGAMRMSLSDRLAM
jgi:hypothetical protein